MTDAKPFTEKELAWARSRIEGGQTRWATATDLARFLSTLDVERARREAAEAVCEKVREFLEHGYTEDRYDSMNRLEGALDGWNAVAHPEPVAGEEMSR